MIEGSEACDGILGGATCTSLNQGFTGGTLACLGDCTFDTSGCTQPSCGDDTKEGIEVCDGSDLGLATCTNLNEGFTGGTLSCANDCTFDKSLCTQPVCGDDVIEGDEICDGSALGGETCPQGCTGGTVTCDNCIGFDTSSCTGCPTAPAITLAATGYKVRGFQHVDLTWSGNAGLVDIMRDGNPINVGTSGTTWTDNINLKGGGSYAYEVCETGTATCSDTANVVF